MPAKTILCATDFSVPAAEASRACAALAAKSGATLVLAHVHPFVADGSSAKDAFRAMLKSHADELRAAGAVVTEEFLGGLAEESLLEAARRHQADLIVLASKKKRGLTSRLLYGSLAEYLAEHANTPTLVVRDATRLLEWIRQGEKLRTFTAVDLAASSDAPLLWTKDFSLNGPTEVAVGYVNWIPDEALRLGLNAPRTFFEESPEVRRVLERDLRDRVTRIFGDTPVTTLVESRWGRADAPLIDLARRATADLIVVGSRQRHGLVRLIDESVSRGTLREAPMNVVIVPLDTPRPAEAPLPAYRRVLVPTDFSPGANRAIPHAYSLVAPGGTVILLHVPDLPGTNGMDIMHGLRALVPAKAAEREIVTQVSVAPDNLPAEGIVHTAARLGADAICMGSHGRTGMAGALLGSVARKVIETSRCPVLLVRNH